MVWRDRPFQASSTLPKAASVRPSLKQRFAYSLREGFLPSWRIGDDVRKPVGRLWRSAVLVLCGLLLIVSLSYAKQDKEPGQSIGKVSTKGDLIVMELDDGALGKAIPSVFSVLRFLVRMRTIGGEDLYCCRRMDDGVGFQMR